MYPLRNYYERILNSYISEYCVFLDKHISNRRRQAILRDFFSTGIHTYIKTL